MATTTKTWRFHADRDGLLAEAHARPSTPVVAPMLSSRIATMAGPGGAEVDGAHMAALCRKMGASEPGPGARWCVLDGGAWRLRWERHTEVSTWTVFRNAPEASIADFSQTALDVVPQDWLSAMPGEVLAACHIAIVAETPAHLPFADGDIIASSVGGAGFTIYTDFRAGPDAFTRFVIVDQQDSPAAAGRVLQQLFEIETYRLLAMLAFPVVSRIAPSLTRLETEAATAAQQVMEEGGVDADRALLSRLAALAGEAETLVGQTGFRFSAAQAYQGLVQERISQLRERQVEGRPSIADFMERRLAPAMRTCASAALRQQDVIARIARTAQMLNTRVEVASEAINVGLLASMDRRSQEQLRLQQTVEGLSVAAITYYTVGVLDYGMKAAAELIPGLNASLATGAAIPVAAFLVWRALRRVRAHINGGGSS